MKPLLKMKNQHIRNSILLAICLFISGLSLRAQDTAKAEAGEPSVALRYFIKNNSEHYLIVRTNIKVGKKTQRLPNQVIKVFLDSAGPENLLLKTTTDDQGEAKVYVPVERAEKWNASAKHNFIGVLEASSLEDERSAELEITRAKIEMDTITEDGVRSITVKVSYLEGADWKPAADVEMRLGVSRSGGILSAGTEESYTTDSTGSVTVEFKRDSLPGDDKGNFVLMAKVEDNDTYGNLLVETVVPWGVPVVYNTTFFDQRTLWTTRFKTPFWLLFMAYTIVIIVWGTVIYLITQIIKIGKLSKQEPN